MLSTSRIVELAQRIEATTAKVDGYLAENGLPRPSFDVDGAQYVIPPTEAAMNAARRAVMADCQELKELLAGPREHLIGFRHNELIAQHAIVRFELARAFSAGQEASFQELAAKSGLHETRVRKLIRYAITQRIFCEPRPGVVAHSAASRVLAEDAGLHNWLRFSTDDLWHAAYHTGDALAKFPASEEPNETGFALSNNSDKNMFDFFTENPERLKRFAAAMRFFTESPPLAPRFVVENYPWGKIKDGGTVVDIGGSHGIICIEVARKFPHLKFVVQDLDEAVIRDAERQCPADVSDRVKFMVHDFFEPQPIHGAGVYFLRAVVHNWSDKYALKILRNLIPVLKPGAKIVLNETVVPEPEKVPTSVAGHLRANDLVMLELQNAGDREMKEWSDLFAVAHPNFEFHGGSQPPGSSLSILEATWKGSS